MASLRVAVILLTLAVVDGCKVLKSGIDASTQKILVDEHNKLRQKIAAGKEPGQPPAANMKQLKWNAELAAAAQKLANACEFEHDTVVTKQYGELGQNLASETSSNMGYNFADAVDYWYDEVNECKFKSALVSKWQDDDCSGHYTQVVWAKTEAVGCGYVAYPSDDGSKDIEHLLVCNYGPSGNFENREMYIQGKACSKCDKGCSAEYPGMLCN